MIVHMIGAAGTGKSTLLQALVSQGLTEESVAGWRRWLSPPYRLAPFYFPKAVRNAGEIMLHQRTGKHRPSRMRWAAMIAAERGRQQAIPRKTLYLEDQGLTNQLRKHCNESITGSVGILPLPHGVIHITVPRGIRGARRLVRNKTGDTFKAIDAKRRSEAGRKRAHLWCSLWGHEEALRCLRHWNQKQCQAQIPDKLLQNWVEEVADSPLPHKQQRLMACEPLPERVRWLHDALTARGVHWLNVVNDGHVPIEELARSIGTELIRWRESVCS